METRLLIGLVEDQLLFREGLKGILNGHNDLEVIFESSDGFSVIEKLGECQSVPDVMLVDISLPPNGKQEFNGLAVTNALTRNYPDMKILILSVHDDENFISQFIANGAHGYLIKDSHPNEVFEAIFSVFHKGAYINERTLKALQNKTVKKLRPGTGFVKLTKREAEILQLVCQQYTAEEIATKLFISAKTVNGHRINLLQKTGSKNVAGLVIYAVKNQLVNLF